MTRSRVALVLAAVAVIAVLATAAVAVATYLRADDAVARPLVVTDVRTGARFEVPRGGLGGPRAAQPGSTDADARARPTAVVTGPAVFRG